MAGRQRQLVLLTRVVRRYNSPDGSAFPPPSVLGRRQKSAIGERRIRLICALTALQKDQRSKVRPRPEHFHVHCITLSSPSFSARPLSGSDTSRSNQKRISVAPWQGAEAGGVARLGMPASSRAIPSRIFISYRREDAAYPAGWLFDRLADKFGKNQVFKDVNSIQLGEDFVEVITAAVKSCDVLLAVIGERWLTITDEQGQQRLENPSDFVRLEIETALARNIRVIPILVGGAQMPRADQLPPSLAKLAHRNALELSPSRFSSDTSRLLAVLERTIAEVQAGDDGDVFTAGRGLNSYLSHAAERPSAPGLLPRDIPGFTGRGDELARLEALARGSSVVVAAIDGAPGVGKTALAIHAAHKLLDAFPDGHLYADLRGYTEGQKAAEPGEVLAVFLRYLKVSADELPIDLEQRSGLFRQLLSSRRMIVILDNVATEEQVRPLLPGAGSSTVLITSRGTLAGLELDERINLDIFSAEQAVELLTRLVGQKRAEADPDAVLRIATLCGRLPLALRLAGQLLEAHRGWQIARLARLLSNEQRRLDTLAVGDRQIRSAFMVSYRHLRQLDSRVFRRLGLFPGQDFDSPVAVALADVDRDAAEQALDRLALAQLVISDADERFRMHDLLRLFAREVCLAEDDETARDEAFRRLVYHFQALSTFLNSCIDPEHRPFLEKFARQAGVTLPTLRQAVTAFETELQNILAVLALASEQCIYDAVWTIAEQIYDGLSIMWRPGVMVGVYQLAFDAAHAAGNKGAEARALSNLGSAYLHLRQFDKASVAFQDAVIVHRETGDRSSEAETLNNLGNAYADLGQFGGAIASYQEALKIRQDIGERHSQGETLINIGTVHRELGQADKAIATYQEALRIHRETDDKRTEGATLTNLGLIYCQLGQFDQAITSFQDALKINRETGDKYFEGKALNGLGTAYRDLGQFDQAIASFQEGLKAHQEIGDKRAEAEAFDDLGGAYWHTRKFDQAVSSFQAALKIHRDTGDRSSEGATVNWLAIAYCGLEEFDHAVSSLQAALKIYRETGDKGGEGIVFRNLGKVYWDMRQFDRAITSFQEAVEIFREAGDKHAEGEALNSLGMLYRELQQSDKMRMCLSEAAEAYHQSGDNDSADLLEERPAEA